MSHDENNEECPLNDPETYANPATAGLPCTCLDFWIAGKPVQVIRSKYQGLVEMEVVDTQEPYWIVKQSDVFRLIQPIRISAKAPNVETAKKHALEAAKILLRLREMGVKEGSLG